MSANPITEQEPWLTLIIGGEVMPGIPQVEDVARKYKWDEKKGKSTKGNALGFNGFDNAEFSVTLQFGDRIDTGESAESQIDRWKDIEPKLRPNPDPKKIKALDVIYPSLNDLDIRSVVPTEIGGLTHAGKGLWTVKMKWKEFVKPTPAGGSPAGSSSQGITAGEAQTPGGKPQPPAQDEQDKEIAKLNAEANKP